MTTRTKKTADEPKFTLNQLAERPEEFLGVPQHLLVGAFHDADGEDEVTISEAKERIQAWLGQPVSVLDPESNEPVEGDSETESDEPDNTGTQE